MRSQTLLRLRSPNIGSGLSWLHDFQSWTDLLEWNDCLDLLKHHPQEIPLLWVERDKWTEKDLENALQLKKEFPDVSVLLFTPSLTLQQFQELVRHELFWQIGTVQTPISVWKAALKSAIQRFTQGIRQEHLLAANRNRNQRLIRMTQSLEQQVQKKTKKLFLSTQRLQHHDHQLERIKALLVQINASDNIQNIYTHLAQQLAHLVPFTELSIIMHDWAGKGLLAIKDGKEGDTLLEPVPLEDEAAIKKTFNGLEPVVLSTGSELKSLLKTNVFSLKRHMSLLFLPLSIGSQIGAIAIASHESDGFSNDHIETLRHLQPPLSVALERVYTLGALKHLQQQWETTFHAINDPVFILDETHNVIRTNSAADQLLKEIPEITRSLAIAAPENAPLKARDREFKRVINPFQHRNRGLSLVLLRETTEEGALLQRLLHSEKLASVGVLSEKVAHELNNPLAGIMALSQLLRDDLDEPLKTDFIEIEKACRRCKHIIENLVRFSKPHSDKPKDALDFNKVIEETLVLARAGLSGVTINTQLSASLPAVRGHFQELQQVIFNLIQNAAQAMQGQGTLTLKTSFDEARNQILCVISDTGDGIPENLLKHIFEPFFTTKRAGVGTGLGLSICKKVIQGHSGDIRLLYSEKTKGTAFEIAIPA